MRNCPISASAFENLTMSVRFLAIIECAYIDDNIANALMEVLPKLQSLSFKGCCCITDDCLVRIDIITLHSYELLCLLLLFYPYMYKYYIILL